MNICSIVLLPLIGKAAIAFDKRIVYVVCMTFSGAVMILAKITTLPTFGFAVAYIIIVSIGTAAYWLFIFNFLYDVVDVDDFKNGKKRDGIIMSFYSFMLKLGGALSSFILGVLLDYVGFAQDSAVQSAKAIGTIESLFTIVPGIFMVLSGLVMLLSPVTHKRIEALHAAQNKKNNGESYDTSDFKELLK